MKQTYLAACENAQNALFNTFWDAEDGITRHKLPFDKAESTCYWWHAHTIDALADAYERTHDGKYLGRIRDELNGTFRVNGGTPYNDFYDDMEWMALALLRVYDMSGDESYKETVLTLWEDIKTAWNDNMGGGMSWTKNHRFYKNTPANAPAAILAARLYRRFGNPQDLDWAKKIYDYNTRVLVDPETGFVWDGINREQDGKIDYDWEYTYCQGVYIGAGQELYEITGEDAYLQNSIRTALYSKAHFSDAHGGVIPNEGTGDCGLFKGIYMRYIFNLLQSQPQLTALAAMIRSNADALTAKGVSPEGLIGNDWTQAPTGGVELCSQLSGIMLLEMACRLPAQE